MTALEVVRKALEERLVQLEHAHAAKTDEMSSKFSLDQKGWEKARDEYRAEIEALKGKITLKEDELVEGVKHAEFEANKKVRAAEAKYLENIKAKSAEFDKEKKALEQALASEKQASTEAGDERRAQQLASEEKFQEAEGRYQEALKAARSEHEAALGSVRTELRQQCEELEGKYESERTQLVAQHEAEVRALRDQQEALNLKMQEAEAGFHAKLQKQVELLEAQEQACGVQAEALQMREDEVASLSAALDEANAEQRNQFGLIRDLKVKVEATEAVLAKSEHENREVAAERDAKSQQLSNAVERHREELAQAKNDFSEAAGKQVEVQSDLEEAKAELATVQERHNDLKENMKKLRKSLRENLMKYAELGISIFATAPGEEEPRSRASSSSDVDSLEGLVAKVAVVADRTIGAVKESQAAVDTAQSAQQEAESMAVQANEARDAAVKDAAKEVEAVKGSLASALADAVYLETKNADLEGIISRHQEALEGHTSTIVSLQQAYESLTSEKDKLAEEKGAAETSAEAFQLEIDEMRREIAALKTKAKDAESERRKSSHLLGAATGDEKTRADSLKALEKRFRKLKIENDALKAEGMRTLEDQVTAQTEKAIALSERDKAIAATEKAVQKERKRAEKHLMKLQNTTARRLARLRGEIDRLGIKMQEVLEDDNKNTFAAAIALLLEKLDGVLPQSSVDESVVSESGGN